MFFGIQANVVCRQLGFYSGAEEAFAGSIFGRVDSEFSYSDVRCSGSEDTLQECQSAIAAFCPLSEGAAVICNKTDIKGKLHKVFLNQGNFNSQNYHLTPNKPLTKSSIF